MADDFEDLTQSSDTATEELDSATSGYRHASLLINQLDTSSIGEIYSTTFVTKYCNQELIKFSAVGHYILLRTIC